MAIHILILSHSPLRIYERLTDTRIAAVENSDSPRAGIFARPSPPETTLLDKVHQTYDGVPAPAGEAHFNVARGAINQAMQGTTAAARAQNLADLQRTYGSQDLDRQVTRRWRVGDVYAPHDLSGQEMSKWKKPRRKDAPRWDVLDQLGMNPMLYYKNFNIMSEYMTPMGRIKHRSETGLRPVNQRKMAKAIRRAIGIGLLPSTYRHPELLDQDTRSGLQQ